MSQNPSLLMALKSNQVITDVVVTRFLPHLSIIPRNGNQYVEAPSNTLPTSKNAVRIFNSLVLVEDSPLNFGSIPISPNDPAFNEGRYWRIPVLSASIFAALIERLHYDSLGCEDIRLAKTIYAMLLLQTFDDEDENNGNGGPGSGGGGGGGSSGDSEPDDDNEGGSGLGSDSEPDDDNENGGGPSGGGTASSKRKGGGSNKSIGSPTKKARKMCGDSGTTREFDVASSTCILKSTNCDDSGNGLSVSTQSPYEEDNPAEWRFGPTFTTNKIVFTARAINLTLK